MSGEMRYWRCPNCGQVHFGDDPPDMCDYCRDYTTWERLYDDRAATINVHLHPTQLPLPLRYDPPDDDSDVKR